MWQVECLLRMYYLDIDKVEQSLRTDNQAGEAAF